LRWYDRVRGTRPALSYLFVPMIVKIFVLKNVGVGQLGGLIRLYENKVLTHLPIFLNHT